METEINKRPGKYLVRGYTRANGVVVANYLRSYPSVTRQVETSYDVITTPNSNLSKETYHRLRTFIKGGEGKKLIPYQDSKGIWTVMDMATQKMLNLEKLSHQKRPKHN